MILFLGGTCNESTWRDELIIKLKEAKIEYFNPVVPDWTPECMKEEQRIKDLPDTIELYVITSEMTGVFSIAEAVDASNKKPDLTIFCVIEEGFDKGQIRSLDQVSGMINRNEGWNCTYDRIINVVNNILDLAEEGE